MRFTKKDKKLIAIAQNQEVYEEDDWGREYLVGYRCKICKRVFTSLDDLEVDHIYPRSRGGVDSPRNLRLLCPRDNKRKSSTIRRRGSTVRRKTSTVRRKGSTVKGKRSTIKRKSSTVKRKGTAAKRKRR
jgi:5-methylcytosine-specific restriction endonuclease McrA